MKDASSKRIPKGTVLQEWNPYKIISLVDKGRETGLGELPDYTHCPVLEFSKDVCLLVNNEGSPDFQRFVDRLFRDGSFDALCILTLIDEILSGKTFPVWDIHNGESYCGSTSSGSDLEDSSLLIEGWPFVQNRVSWKQFLFLYRCIESCIHMLTIDHPLTHYAKHGIFHTSSFGEAVEIARRKKLIPKESKNKLQVSQLLMDYVASMPPRVVGILIDDPFSSSNPKHFLNQSSAPSAYLELTVDKVNNQMRCKMISMYDLYDEEPITVSTRVNGANLSKKNELDDNIDSTNKALLAQRVAHSHFQNGKYSDALCLYKKCYEFFSPIDELKAADLLHSMAAVRLSEYKFLDAQREWEKGSRFQKIHPGIALQLQKQRAYKYFDSWSNRSYPTKVLPYEAIGFSRKLFITQNAVSPTTCAKLIEWANLHASENGGWQTARHYQVPTNDIPLHVSENLLNWFVEWFRETAMPLLQEQFETKQTFFVHDCFLVRYIAGSSSDHLPLHRDEASHSIVLALNSEFEGGGTYFYTLDHTCAPSCGTLVSFRGNQLLHGGQPVASGTRFIIAAFLYLDDETPEKQKRSSSTQLFLKDLKRPKSQEGFSFGFF